jgi:hypothetical protein
MRRGKHVYCEKPLAHSVCEARLMRETSKQMKVATQMGTQIHAADNYRRVVELIQSGASGPLREARVWGDQAIEGPVERSQETPPGSRELALGPLARPRAGAALSPLQLHNGFQAPLPSIAPSAGHHEERIQACKTGSPTLCNFDDSGALIEHNLLGTAAFRVGKKLERAPVNFKARNGPEADPLLRPPSREGCAVG